MTDLKLVPKPALKLVAPPTATDEIRQSIVGLLDHYLQRAQAGELASLCILATTVDGYFNEAMSGCESVTRVLGQLEVAKARWVAQYLEETAGLG